MLQSVFFLLATSTLALAQDHEVQTEEVAGRNGGFVALRCGFSEVEWFKKDPETMDLVPAEELGRRTVVLTDGTMYLSRLKEADRGVYVCRKYDNTLKEVTLVMAALPHLVVGPSDVTTTPGALVHFACEGSGDPEPTIEWRIGRSALRRIPVIPDGLTDEEVLNYSGDRFLQTEKGHLYIRDVTPQYSAQYICVLTNSGGSTYGTAKLLVVDPPKITTRPADMQSLDSDVIGFACRATGNPRPVVSWHIETFDGLVIEDPKRDTSGRYEIDSYKSLRVRYPVPSDSGRYTCIATNRGGSVNSTAILQVLITPQFRHPPKDAWVPVGSSAIFTCTVYGSPLPVIEWLKDNARLPFSNTYQIQHVARLSEVQEKLVFRQVFFEDTGFYECRATNPAGTSRYEFSMAVTEAMPFPGDRFVQDALDYAHQFVQSAVQETQIVLQSQFQNPNFQPTPQDLFHMVRQPTRQTLYMAMSAEVFEHALDYIHQQIERMNRTSLERNQQPLGSLLSPEALDHLEDLSGCKARVKMPKCQMRCQLMSFRSHDGTCNNVRKPLWGSALHSLNRFLPALYENKYNTPRGWSHNLPSARSVSQRLLKTHTTEDHSQFSVLMMHFGQFLDHDIAQTVTGPIETTFAPFLRVRCEQTFSNNMPCFPISIATNDTRIDSQCMPFVRSAATCGTGDTSVFGKETKVREQLNQITSFLDASNVYGSADEEMETLRDRTANKGQLRVGEEYSPGKHLLPIEDNLIPEELESERRCIGRAATVFLDCFIAGDHRATEQPGLTTLHTVFMRLHNDIAYRLSEINPQWNDDRLYEESRKIVGAIMQHVTYKEYLPKVLGMEGMEMIGEYTGYNPDTDPTLLNEFATAAFRFGHTLIPPTLFRRAENYHDFDLGDMPLHNSFFTPYRITDEGGIDPILRGMIIQNLKLPDGKVTDAVTERLFHIVAQVSLDLAAINIQRGRDHAIATYNDMRQECGMRRALNFHDLQNEIRNATTRQILSELYDSVDDIDLWVGGLEEDVVDGALVGPTFRCIIAEQFRRTRDGDRFWFEADNHFTPDQLRQIKKVTLAKVFCDTADNITRVPEDVFLHNPDVHRYTSCEDLPMLDLNVFMDCGGPDYLRYQSVLFEHTAATGTLTGSTATPPPPSTAGGVTTPAAAAAAQTTPAAAGEDHGGDDMMTSEVMENKMQGMMHVMTLPPDADMMSEDKPMQEDINDLLSQLESMNAQLRTLDSNIQFVKSKVMQFENRVLVEGGCEHEGKVYSQGQEWSAGDCTKCYCQGGLVDCSPDPSCARLVV